MKKLNLVLLFLLSMMLTACGNAYAKREYQDDEKIARKEDHYAKAVSVFCPIDGGYSFTASRFDGRETLWKQALDEDQEIALHLSFHLAKGQAKLVHIDDENNVTTVLECAPGTETDEWVMRTVAFRRGQNRLKMVGYDCEAIDLQLLFEEP